MVNRDSWSKAEVRVEEEGIEKTIEMEPIRFDAAESASIALRALRGDRGASWNLKALEQGLCETKVGANVGITDFGYRNFEDLPDGNANPFNGDYLEARLFLPNAGDQPPSFQQIDGYNAMDIRRELEKIIKQGDGDKDTGLEIMPGLFITKEAADKILDFIKNI